MKVSIQISRAFILLLLFLLNFALYADERTVSYESYIIENFDGEPLNNWIVRGSDYTVQGYPKLAKVNIWPQALYGKNREGKPYYTLGIRGSFDRRGYNFIEIIPAKEATDKDPENTLIKTDENGKKWVHNPITLRGRAKTFDVWVWGANFNYYMEVHLEDYLGIVHVLPLGELLYSGWRNLSVNIPPYIPQYGAHIPRIKPLKFVKFVVWTKPSEVVNDFYVYLDQIKVLTDLFESRYDGDELEEEAFLDEIWSRE